MTAALGSLMGANMDAIVATTVRFLLAVEFVACT